LEPVCTCQLLFHAIDCFRVNYGLRITTIRDFFLLITEWTRFMPAEKEDFMHRPSTIIQPEETRILIFEGGLLFITRAS